MAVWCDSADYPPAAAARPGRARRESRYTESDVTVTVTVTIMILRLATCDRLRLSKFQVDCLGVKFKF
jgi:hypothetical protein